MDALESHETGKETYTLVVAGWVLMGKQSQLYL